MNISIFKNMTSKLPLPGLLEGVANLIRTDEKLKAFTASYRQTGSKTFKSECPLFAVACTFEGGKGQDNITGLTRLSLVDFDHILSEEGKTKSEKSYSLEDLKAKIIADPHTLMCYTTISGNGLRIIYKYELPNHNNAPQLITNNSSLITNNWLPINDRRVNSLWAEMSLVTRVNKQDIYSIIESDYVPPFNPFKDYFENLTQIHTESTDEGAIKILAKTVCVKGGEQEQLRWEYYLRKWLVAMVASWLSSDAVNNVILVLIGEQGAFKTTWFNYLLPPELKQYFYTKTNANRMSKDDLLTLAQYGLVCCEELDTMRPAELNQLKAVVTMPNIDERAAYAHYHEHRKHIASFCGTGNNPQFLTDPTGNRRWLPFEVESIVSPREHPFDYEAIYSEAYALYKSGFRYWFEKEEIQELNKHNREFETPHLERELVDLYFRKPGPAETGEFMSVARALQIISAGISQKLSAVNVGRAFVELGFERVRTRSCRGFTVVSRTAEEMKAYQFAQLQNAEPDVE